MGIKELEGIYTVQSPILLTSPYPNRNLISIYFKGLSDVMLIFALQLFRQIVDSCFQVDDTLEINCCNFLYLLKNGDTGPT